MASKGRGLRKFRHAKHCARKQRFPNKTQAYAALERMPRDIGGPLNAYECSVCKGWHIGHTPTQRRPDF